MTCSYNRIPLRAPVTGIRLLGQAGPWDEPAAPPERRPAGSGDAASLEVQMQTAWDAGYQAGLHEAASSDTRAAESASADLAQGLHTLQAVIEAIQAEQTTLLHVSERAVIELASAVASKVVQRTVEADDDLVVRSVREALRCLNRVNRLTLRVHPADLRVVESFQPEFSVLLDTTCAITVVEDASVSRGGCIMDTDAGAIDARIATRLSEIKLALLSACDMDQNPRHEPGADDMTPEMELAV